MEPIKQEVLDFIKFNGPILPYQVGKKIEKNLILAGAILSDLLSEKFIKISVAKIGGSPVYYVAGQEPKLEKLYEYLPGKEKEAYNLLKEKKVLKDIEIPAGIRVALRSIRDFAIPFKHNDEIYWHWYMLPQQEVENYLPKLKVKPIKPIKVEAKIIKNREKFLEEVKRCLVENKLEIVEEIQSKKKNEADIIVKFSSDIGELEFLASARNRKRINEADLSLAYHKGQKLKLPVLFLSPGSLTKKAEVYLRDNLRGYLIFKAMN